MFYKRLVVALLIFKLHLNFAENHNFLSCNLEETKNFENDEIASKACEIAAQVDARLNLIYTSVRNDSSACHLERAVLHCMMELPSYTLQLENFNYELRRDYSSLSVFMLDDVTSLNHITAMLNAKQESKHMHKYIFIWRKAQGMQLRKLFEAVWSKRILNIIALTSRALIYTFEPFTPAGFTVQQLGSNELYFYDKLKNLHHYQLRISMFQDFLRAIPRVNSQMNGYEGVDGLMASNIVRKLNATVIYITPTDNENYGACLSNGTFTGVLRELIADRTHVNFNAQFVLPCSAEHIETIYPYFKRILYIVVPAAEMFPEYLIFIYAYTNGLWRVLTLFFVFIVALFALLKHCIERHCARVEKMKNARWLDLVLLFWRSQFGVPITSFSKMSSLRLYFITWLFFNYVMSAIYFAKVESIFVHPSYYREMDHLDELPNLNVPIFSVQNLQTAIKPALKPAHWRAIERHVVTLPSHFTSFQYAVPLSMRKGWRAAFLLRGDTAKDLLVKTYDGERQRARLHIVREHLLAMPQTYLLAKGSPFRLKFQDFESRVFESGLYDNWSSRRSRYSDVRSPSLTDLHKDLPKILNFEDKALDDAGVGAGQKRKVVLSLGILQGPFYIWCVGLLLSSFVFMLEHAYCWYRTPKVIMVKVVKQK